MRRLSSGGGGGCCTTRYTTNTTPYIPYYTNDHVSKMDRIMLRFRPIAPKPATSGPTSTSSSSGSTSPKKRKSPTKTTKPNNNNIRKKSRSPSNTNVVTLSLLPETPDLTRNDNNGNGKCNKEPTWLNFGPSDEDLLTALEVIPSTVTVEKVSATWQDECITDEERKRRLEADTCPGFISDGWNRVWWTNEEYRKMVTRGDIGKEDTWRKERLVSVKMEMREKIVNIYGGGFTCRVRVQYGNSTMTVPCDVWRMNSGGFAWRLDVKAALTLAL